MDYEDRSGGGASAAHDAFFVYCRDNLPKSWERIRHIALISLRFCALLLAERRVGSRISADDDGERDFGGIAEDALSVESAALQPDRYPGAAVLAGMCGAEGPLGSLLDVIAMYALLCDELCLTEEEKVYFGPSSLSVMLAKLCRNCTHIRPMSCFHY